MEIIAENYMDLLNKLKDNRQIISEISIHETYKIKDNDGQIYNCDYVDILEMSDGSYWSYLNDHKKIKLYNITNFFIFNNNEWNEIKIFINKIKKVI